jgi:hypothetical protein
VAENFTVLRRFSGINPKFHCCEAGTTSDTIT